MNSRKMDVEKWIWSDADFEQMGWHDVQVHGIAVYEKVERNEVTGVESHFSFSELLLDIDYILKWVKPDSSDPHFEFWIAPSTLVFERVEDFEMRWVSHQPNWEIQSVERQPGHHLTNGDKCRKWEVLGTGMTFLATGYKQYIRRKPVMKKFQSLTYEERGGSSFSKQTGDRD